MVLKNLFNWFNKNKQPNETSFNIVKKKPRNEIIRECYDKGLTFVDPIIKVVYTDDKTERAVILQKSDRLYTVAFEKIYFLDDDELTYNSVGLQGYWCTDADSMNSFLDTEENAVDTIYSTPPFKFNKCIVWAGYPFRIDAENLYWIKNDGIDDPDDLCLHGHVIAKIGEEIFDYNATVSATGLYLLSTLTVNHIAHYEEAMLPCCGHWMIANDDLTAVDISGCTNGIDWSVIHEDGKIKLVTEAGNETFIDLDYYKAEVHAFADKIADFYRMSSPKNLLKADTMSRDGYIAFWNEWYRHKK